VRLLGTAWLEPPPCTNAFDIVEQRLTSCFLRSIAREQSTAAQEATDPNPTPLLLLLHV